MSANQPTKQPVSVVPVGPMPGGLLPWLVKHLSEVLEQPAVLAHEIPLPEGGYDSRRKQYQGEAILEVLRQQPQSSAGQVLGLVDADCYAPGLNFIFGQAALGGQVAFVALPRLRQSFLGLPDDPHIFRQRVLKEAVHELGYTWGLAHCPDQHCVMYFSNSLQDTDLKSLDFCPSCMNRVASQT